MQLKLIIDNKIAAEGFDSAWGFSCLVGKDLLFDTGESTALLFRNLAQAGVRPENLKIVAVSHGDEDHTGGLIGLLEQNPSIQVVLHTKFPQDLITHLRRCGARLTLTDALTELSPDIFMTGPYPTREQALVIQSKTGLVVLTGCAHPDPVKILENIRNKMTGEIDLVIGGFHLVDQTKSETLKTINEFRSMGVKRVGPCHCTGEKAIKLFKEEYGYDFLEVGAGFTLEV
jgi:7,8-dihydropterin-6-yl-methyl-4-(beta-D-ribofuranosyl)aminobenzene 5'-phosphate synthase